MSRFAWDQTTPCANGSNNRLWLSLDIDWDFLRLGPQAGRWVTQKAASMHLALMRHCRARCLSLPGTTKFPKKLQCAYSEGARIGVTHMATTPANRAVENGLNEQGRKQRRSDSRRDSTIVIIGILTIIVGAIGAAITAFMG